MRKFFDNTFLRGEGVEDPGRITWYLWEQWGDQSSPTEYERGSIEMFLLTNRKCTGGASIRILQSLMDGMR